MVGEAGEAPMLYGSPNVEEPLSDTVLCVRYTGTSHVRILSRRDLSGNPEDSDLDKIMWQPGGEIDHKYWLEYAGSEERASEMLSLCAHEFELVGPGAEDVDEFDFVEVKDD